MAISGRSVRISRNGSNIVGARADSVTVNNEPLDITDKDDAGWRTMLDDVGLRTVSCEIEGVMKDDVLMTDSVGDATTALLKECVVTISGIGTLTGDFYLSSVQIGAEQADVVTFTATLESGEAMTATIGPYNTVLPSIAGDTSQGSGLTTTNGTWVGDATITYARQWQRATLGQQFVTNGTFAAGVSGWSGYNGTLSWDSVNKVAAVAASSDNVGLSQVFTPTTVSNYLISVTITNGASVSRTFSAFVDTPGLGTFQAVTLSGGETRRVSLLVTNAGGNNNLLIRTVGSFTPQSGETHYFDNIIMVEYPSDAQLWANIASATGQTYTLAAADAGKYLRCRVTATNGVGSTVAYSNILGPIT